jgi:hypothetical protein
LVDHTLTYGDEVEHGQEFTELVAFTRGLGVVQVPDEPLAIDGSIGFHFEKLR